MTGARLLLWIVPSVVLGIPLGAALIARLDAEVFRRLCMSFDAWIVGFGLSRMLVDLGLVASPIAYGFWGAVLLVDACLLYAFFDRRRVGRGAERLGSAAESRSHPAPARLWESLP